MIDPGSADFFISYTAQDRQWAEWIAWQLETAGYTVVVQAWDFVPGQDFIHAMEQAISSSSATLAVLSDAYLTSAFGELEWRSVLRMDPSGQHSKLIPVRVEECDPPALLASRVYVDLVRCDAAEASRRLLAATGRGRARPVSEPTFPRQEARAATPRYPGDHASRLCELGEFDLRRGLEVPGGMARLWLSLTRDSLVLGVPIDAYANFGDFLDELFTRYLAGRFRSFSYGSEWLLVVFAQDGSRWCLMPATWLDARGQLGRPQEDYWAPSVSLADLGVSSSDQLFVLEDVRDSTFFALATEEPETVELLRANAKALYYVRDLISDTSPPWEAVASPRLELAGLHSFVHPLRDIEIEGLMWAGGFPLPGGAYRMDRELAAQTVRRFDRRY